VRTSGRTKIAWAAAGVIVFTVGVGWLLLRGPQPFGEVLTILGGGFAASLLASAWIYRNQG
jgi:hypothetical protein